MKKFPDFMKRDKKRVNKASQNTEDVEGYYYIVNDGSQAAFWTHYADSTSREHCRFALNSCFRRTANKIRV